MNKYILTLIIASKTYRTKISASSEYYARNIALDKASERFNVERGKIIIQSCELEKWTDNTIFDFMKGFRK